ncbi:MAG: hypothetical protein HYY16_02325 [Planctomycetes bacterium]|nr:hypothetical protein [Planctomycetota bacterium]
MNLAVESASIDFQGDDRRVAVHLERLSDANRQAAQSIHEEIHRQRTGKTQPS